MELVENFLSVLEKQHSLIEQLSDNKTGSKNIVDKNIVKSKNSTFGADDDVSPRLNSDEKTRVKEVSSIFINKFFEEQKRQKKDTAEKTLVSKIKKPLNVASKKKEETKTEKAKDGGGWLSKLLSMFGLGALAKLLKPGALKTLIKKGLSKLFSIFKGVISYLWKGIKNLFGNILKGLRGLMRSIMNSKFIKGLKNLVAKVWNGIKKGFRYVGRKILDLFKSVGKSIRGLWASVKSSKAYNSLAGLVKKASESIAGFFNGIKDKLASLLRKTTEGIQKVVPGGVKAVGSKIGGVIKKAAVKTLSTAKSFVSKGADITKTIAKKGVSVTKAVAKKGVSVTKAVAKKGTTAVLGAGKAVASTASSASKAVVKSAAKNAIKATGGMFKMMGRLTAKGAARVPIIGPAIEGVLATLDIKAMKKKGLSNEDLQKQAGKRVISGVTGMVGAAGGAALAGTLGSIIPGAGTAIGAILGAIGGDAAGRFLGKLISDYIIPEKYVRTIGAFVTGTPPPKEEMQDFIIKDGRIHKFNRRDEIMGLKTGGAINEFLSKGSQTETLNSLIHTNNISNQYLKAIAHNTALMIKKFESPKSSGSPIVVANSSPEPTPKQMITVSNNRKGYLTSPYAIG